MRLFVITISFLLLIVKLSAQNYVYLATSGKELGANFDLYKADLNSCTSTKLATIPSNTLDIAFNPLDSLVYFIGDDQYLFKYDPLTNELIKIKDLLQDYTGLTFNQKGVLFLSSNNNIYKTDVNDIRSPILVSEGR